MDLTDLRMECLRLAALAGEHHELVVKAAQAYVAFVSGGSADAKQDATSGTVRPPLSDV